MQAPYFPARAAEFPNDNPALHQGARWVCRSPSEPARALVNARDLPAAIAPAAPVPVAAVEPSAAAAVPVCTDIEVLVRNCKGPLQLDLSRLVLAHRVENVPPPPEFVFRPFVSSRALSSSSLSSSSLPASAPSALRLEPLRCRIIDEQAATHRVERRWRVDVAPCVAIESPAVARPSVPEQPSRRRRRVPAHGGPRSIALPQLMDLSRAISELEAAFAERPLSGDSASTRPPALPAPSLPAPSLGSVALAEAR